MDISGHSGLDRGPLPGLMNAGFANGLTLVNPASIGRAGGDTGTKAGNHRAGPQPGNSAGGSMSPGIPSAATGWP
jgi:hypothetical protein